MIEARTVLGISMARRQNRRVLVLATYGLFAAFTVAVGMIPAIRSTRIDVFSTVMPIFTILWSFIAYYLFGRIANPRLVAPWWWRSPERIDRGLGLSATVPEETPRADERDLAIRNSAYYYAYQVFLAICLLAMLALGIGQTLPKQVQNSMNFCSVMLLLVVAFTLPQAIILWCETDVIAEP